MALSANLAAEEYGLGILMELTAERAPLSRAALRDRSGLTPRQIDSALAALCGSGLIARQDGLRGRYFLAKAPEEVSVRRVRRAFGGRIATKTGTKAAGAGSSLAGLDPRTTLAELCRALGSAEADICPYYDACIMMGGPNGPVLTSTCKYECAG